MDYVNKIARLITEDPDLFVESDLPRQLKWLEEEYFDQVHTRRKDLIKINDLRTQLGMPEVDKTLKPIGTIDQADPETPEHPESSEPILKPKPSQNNPYKEMYKEYLEKEERLQRYKDHANKLIIALHPTDGNRTPVGPLATMGTDGEQIVCDHCENPILLEGGGWQGVDALTAWRESDGELESSFITGGLITMDETNGTFRAYHDYKPPCYKAAENKSNRERKEYNRRSFRSSEIADLKKFLRSEDLDENLADKIIKSLYDFDPGVGVNTP